MALSRSNRVLFVSSKHLLHRRRKRGGWGGFSPPQLWEKLQKTPFSPSRISGKNDLSPPKGQKNVMSPPPQNSFRRPWFTPSRNSFNEFLKGDQWTNGWDTEMRIDSSIRRDEVDFFSRDIFFSSVLLTVFFLLFYPTTSELTVKERKSCVVSKEEKKRKERAGEIAHLTLLGWADW